MAYIRLLCFLKSQQSENINTKTKKEWQQLAVDRLDTTKMTETLLAKTVPFAEALSIVADKVDKTRLVKGKCHDQRIRQGDIIQVRPDLFPDGRPTLNEHSHANGSFFVLRIDIGTEKEDSKKYLERPYVVNGLLANRQYQVDVNYIINKFKSEFDKHAVMEMNWKEFVDKCLIDKAKLGIETAVKA